MKKLLTVFSVLILAVPLYAVKPVQITTRSLPNGQNGVAYTTSTGATVKINAKFGTKPYTCTKSGTMPTGLTLNASCTITGTPTVNGVYTVTYIVTDSSGSPTVDSRTLSITIAGGAVVTPVQIDTGTLPSGQEGVAYSATFVASGGTAPYTYSKVAGTFPAGLSLSTDTLSGTPTASGSYTFTIRVTDAGSQTYDRAFGLTIAAAVAPTYLFSDGFESGCIAASCQGTTGTDSLQYFPAWTAVNCGAGGYCANNQNTTKHAGSYAYEQEYYVCGDSTNAACGALHQDLNRYVRKDFSELGFPTGMTHVFVRGYVYFKTPEVDATSGKITQRKLIRLTDAPLGYATYEILLQGWSGSAGVATNDSRISLSGHFGTNGAFTTVYDLATVPYNTWTRVEIEVLLNTPGVSDGTIKVYVGNSGTPVYSNTALAVRNTKTTNLSVVSVGAQVDRTTYYTIHEKRYWDDLIVDDAYIGP